MQQQHIYFKAMILCATKMKLVHLVVRHWMDVLQHASKWIRIAQRFSALFLSHIVPAAKAI